MGDPGTDVGTSNPEPPPPNTPPPNADTKNSREVTEVTRVIEGYDGGANERTPLINEQPKPIDNFLPGQNRKIIHKDKLRDSPNRVICPRCSKTVDTILERNPPNWTSCCNSNCSWHCCICYSFCWFIPNCIGKSVDFVHYCPECTGKIASYTKFNSCC
ncbi:unnamed protein product [Rhizophagus irregularis]|uniref:LITAF domain-containing protein n=1 Tax=Rhizophagus irregularis TaxID=588596 RepID=A0A2N1NHW6_9GLOM|nr:hypothetical protein RhiirC2_337929 [Rhizophagus irregularis]CAB4395102.1 unnamed protein product [Rhizophagus irregularis]CAB5359472.1 unnamed protein product [Rhizophagus irregularis]